MRSRVLLFLLFGYVCPVVHGQQRLLFTPDTFSNSFSAHLNPVLHIRSGDTVQTETIDAMGRDRHGMRRQHGGNPLTGPFYIEGSVAGDVLKITLTRVSLNRDYAFTSEGFVGRSVADSLSGQFKRPHLVRWKLDREHGVAMPDSPVAAYPHLRQFQVPLHPFLGCIGVAPGNAKGQILSFFQGDFGGNLDFSGNGQGATIYLPVFHDGGLLYIGDGHALQGDGEIAGNALETSLDVEFRVELLSGGARRPTCPRVEDSVHIISLGCEKTLDKAIKVATTDLIGWLQQDYGLTLPEATQVMSTSVEYVIGEVADPNVVVVAKLKKRILQRLRTE